MGLFDIFSTKPAEQARDAQIAGLNSGYDLAGGLYKAGNTALTTGANTASNLYSGLQQSTQAGSDAYGDASGANGPEGLARAKANFTQTPGYQSGFDLLTDTNDRRAASRGMLGSGNTVADTAKLATTYADQNYGNYASRLQPYLGANAGAVAGGANVATGLGSALNANDVSQGQLGFQKDAGIGNANANADLAKYNASANMLKGITSLMSPLAMATGGMNFGSPSGTLTGQAATQNASMFPGYGTGGNAPGIGGTPSSSGFDLSSLMKFLPAMGM